MKLIILKSIYDIGQILKRIYNAFKNNMLYIIWFYVYFSITWLVFGANDKSFHITTYMYIIILIVTLSPIGEWLLRFFNRIRKLEMSKEKDYLLPLFNEVYEKTKKTYPHINEKIQICVIDAFHVNTMAIGRKTIAVTKGAVETLSDEELKGLIAHEMGHIVNGNTKAIIFILIAEKIFKILVWIFSKTMKLFELLAGKEKAVKIIAKIIRTICKGILIAMLFIVQITLALNSRLNEYRADKFAYEIGYGENLVSALYVLVNGYTSDEPSIIRLLKEITPILPRRIGRLERLIKAGEQKNE